MVFEITDAEHARTAKWLKRHRCDVDKSRQTITYCFTLTGIGTAVVARCTCGAQLELTDYSRW